MDVVISYVNDRDPGWQLLRANTLPDPTVHNEDANVAHRYRDRQELRYALRSIHQYLPWVRKIYLVVSSPTQVPEWLNTKKIHIVTHAEIRVPSPCFNSHAIEANLHRIPGISEPFLYFNDDMLIKRPLSYEDFVSPDGRHYIWLSYLWSQKGKAITQERGHVSGWKNVNHWLDQRFSPRARRCIRHGPAVISPLIMKKLWELLPRELARTTASPFRSIHDYAVTCALHQYYSWYIGKALPGYLSSATISDVRDVKQVLRALAPHAFYCLNDVGNEDQKLVTVFETLLPEPSPYEKQATFRKKN